MFKGVLWKRHALVLGLAVAAASAGRRLGIAALGRLLPTTTTPKHAIKRVDRFVGNPRFKDREAQMHLLRTVMGPRKFVRIAVDWTNVRQWPALVAGVVVRGRSIPVLWQVMDWKGALKSQNSFEHGFFTWLREALPEDVQAVVLLDRGFERVSLIEHLRRCGLAFVIRSGGNVQAVHAQYRGPLQGLVTTQGQKRDLHNVVLRPSRPVQVRVVGMWERRQQKPSVLVTDLQMPAEQIAALYGRRFQIEEMFRDAKDWRFGIAIGQLHLTKALRVERMLLVAAVVHLLAMLVGGEESRRQYDRSFRANTECKKPTHSDFTLGLFFAPRMRWKRSELLPKFWAEAIAEFWG